MTTPKTTYNTDTQAAILELRSMWIHTCQNPECGKEFNARPRNPMPKFCSLKCLGATRRSKKTNFASKGSPRACKNPDCDTIFCTDKGRLFCKRYCYYDYMKSEHNPLRGVPCHPNSTIGSKKANIGRKASPYTKALQRASRLAFLGSPEGKVWLKEQSERVISGKSKARMRRSRLKWMETPEGKEWLKVWNASRNNKKTT